MFIFNSGRTSLLDSWWDLIFRQNVHFQQREDLIIGQLTDLSFRQSWRRETKISDRASDFQSEDPGFDPLAGKGEFDSNSEQFFCPSESTLVQTCLHLTWPKRTHMQSSHRMDCICTCTVCMYGCGVHILGDHQSVQLRIFLTTTTFQQILCVFCGF